MCNLMVQYAHSTVDYVTILQAFVPICTVRNWFPPMLIQTDRIGLDVFGHFISIRTELSRYTILPISLFFRHGKHICGFIILFLLIRFFPPCGCSFWSSNQSRIWRIPMVFCWVLISLMYLTWRFKDFCYFSSFYSFITFLFFYFLLISFRFISVLLIIFVILRNKL